jgi:TonB family protein
MLAMSYRLIASCRVRTKCRHLFLAVAFVGAVFVSKPLAAQTRYQTTVERKVVNRVEPEYPEALKRLYIGGVVRVEAVVSPTGAVESTQLLGGSPILGQSAMKAIKQWKYTPSGSKEKLIVQMEFDPHR